MDQHVARDSASMAPEGAPRLGVLQWYWYEKYEMVECSIEELEALGVRDLRTGVSWADAMRDRGWEWLDWLIPRLAEHFDLLPCLTFTPPSESEHAHSAAPPRDIGSYAAFTEKVMQRYGDHFEWVQLWNEPNNDAHWLSEADPALHKFGAMVRPAAAAARRHGKRTLLGGISPINRFFFSTLEDSGEESTLQYFDAVGIHGFAGRLEDYWQGWETGYHSVRTMLDWLGHEDVEIWIDEVGYPATTLTEEEEQVDFVARALHLPVPRVYVYSLYDMPERIAVYDSHTTGHDNPDVRTCGILSPFDAPRREKQLYRLWKKEGVSGLLESVPT